MAENLTKKEKKLMKATKKRAIILSLLAFGGLSIGSLSFLPFLLKSWNTLQYNIVDFKHINRDNIGYELEFALSDLDSYKLNYQDLNVDFTADEQGKDVIASHKAIYDEFSRTWRLSSNYNGLSFGKRYYLKVYLDDKKQKRFSAKKVIAFGQNVTNFVDTPPAVSTINFQTKTPSSASVSLKFADEAANLEGKKVALEYYYVLKNQSAPTDVLSNSQEIHTSYVDSATVKNGVAEFSLENLHPGMDYKISAIRYVDSSAPASDIPLVPMQKIALAPEINYEQDAQKEKLFEATTGKYNYRAESLIDQNLSFDSKRLTVNFSTLDSNPNLENKPIKLNYTNILTGQKFSVSSFFAANLASFDLNNLAPGSSYQIESFELESSKVEFGQTFIKNFHTPAAIVESKIATGATFAKVDLSVVSVDNLEGTKAHLYLDDSSILPVSGVFRKTDQPNSYQISFEPKGLTNKTKYGLSKVVFDSLSPNSVFAKNRDGYDYLNLAWDNSLETGSQKRNFITSISDLKTFIKLEPKILASKVEYTFGFGLDSSFLNDKELYLYYHKKDEPQKVYKSKASIPQGSEIKFELENFESSTTYKLEKIVISDYPEVAVAINFDQNKKTQQNLPLDEFFVKYYVSDISFENVDQTSAVAKVTINGDFKNIQEANLDLNAKIVFGQPGFTNLTETINLNLANLAKQVPVSQAGSALVSPTRHELQDDKLVMYFDLKNLDPKTQYQVADVEILGKTDFFSSEGILDLNARFTTTFQKVKIIGANFESISLTSANASIYIDPNFNRYLNGKQFNAIFKSEDGQEIKSKPLDTSATSQYSVLSNNILSVKLENLSPGKKYTFFKLEPAPDQDEAFDNLEYKFIDLNQQETDDLPYFYTLSDIASISAEPTQDSAKLVVNFTTKDPNYNKRANSSLKKAVIFLKNNATGTVASAQADQIKYENGLNKVEFNVQNLDKLSHYTVSEILLDGQKIEFNESLKQESAAQRNFATVASTAKIIKVVQTAQSHDKMAIELSFDPVSDTFLNGDKIKVVLQNSKDNKTVEASGTVDQNLVLKLNFDKEVEAGSEYSILSITNETKNKDIQTSVGFLFQKRLDNYSPDLEKTSIASKKFYSSPELKTFQVTSNENETVKVKLTFADAQKLLLQQVASQQKQLTLLIKNTETNAIVASSAEAKQQGDQIEADFTFSNLDRAVKYELVSVNDYSRPDYLIYKDNNNFKEDSTKSFVVNVDSIEIKNLVYSDIKQNSVKAEIYFDPIRDSYLANKQIEVEIKQDGDPVAQLVTVDALAQSATANTNTRKTVTIQKLDDGRLRAEIVFEGLAEGKDFKIAALTLANKSDVKTNAENTQSGPKFKIVNDFLAQGDGKSAEITASSNQKTLKFATDVVVSKIEFNPTDSTTGIDKQQSAKIKVEFSNSNNELLKLKKDQLATLTLINKLTGKIVLASAKIKAEESVAGQTPKTSASVEFEFNNNLEKLTKYEVSSISVVRPNGIYSIPFAANIVDQPKTFVTQLTTVSVKNISYVDVSETSVELTVFFDSVNDDILNEQFEAELEYVLKTKDTELKKSSKVTVSNNQAVFTIENLDEASTYEVKGLKLSKKVLARSTRSLRRTRRQAPEASPVANNISVVFDKTEVEDKHKKFFSTKSLISEIKIDKTLLEQELATKMPGLTLEQTNLTDTQAGIELKIKDPKQFFKDYVSGPKATNASQDIKLVVKSNRTGAISQAGAQISFDEQSNVATVKFLLEDLEKYTVYSIVDIFVNGVRLGFLNTLTENQKEFATTARDVTPNYIAQTEFKRHGAVLRMVFDINKNWFLVNNKVRLTFKKFQAAGADDPDLSVETTVDQDGLAVFKINKDNLANKVPVGSRFEISKLEFIPDVDANQKVVKYFPLNTVISTDSTKTHSASQSSSLVPLARSRRSLSVFDSSSSGVSQFQDNAQASGQVSPAPTGAAASPDPADSQAATLANTNFLNVNISTSPLQDPTVPASVPAPAVKTTFDTASFISAVEKVNLSGTNAELRITLNSTLLLDAQSPTIKLHYIDITDGQEHKADLIGRPAAGSSTSQYTFRANNLKTLNYYQIVSVNYADNNNAEQVIAFDDQSVKYEDKLFRTTPTSFSVKKIDSTYNSSKKTANVKITLDDQVAQYLENYTVRVSYQRIDKTNANTTVSTVEGIINSDSTVSVELSGNYTDANQKRLIIPEASTNFRVDSDTNTVLRQPTNVERSVSTEVKRIDQNKLFETYNYKITKVELIQKPGTTSGRAKRSVATSSPNLVDFNSNYKSLATFDNDRTQTNKKINETSIIQTSPIALYDQLIYVEEKDKFSGIDATIYAYFISSEDLSDQDRDKNNFRVQLYNESLKKYEQIRKASSIRKLNDSGRQAGSSHFYVATFETNLNKASLYNIEFFAYKDQKIELSEYKTNRVDKTQFTTPGEKAWLTNFSQVGAYQDEAANVIFQFDEKDEYLWRNKHKVELEITEKLDQPTPTTPGRGAARPSVTKFSFIPDGPISRVTIDNTSSKDQRTRTSLAPNKTYEITKFTIKEPTSPAPGAGRLSTSNRNLRIKTVDARNQVATVLGPNRMEVAKFDSVEVENAPVDQKIPFFETKAQFEYEERTNFSQDDNTDADGRSATLEFTFNKHFLQIPKSFATITIIRSDATTATVPAGSAPGTAADQTEISFISESQYDPATGRVTFKLNNLDRFHTYDIKNFEIGGVKIDNLAASRNLKFTPTVQKIFLADLEVKDLKTGTTGTTTPGNTGSGASAQTSGGLNPTKEDGSKVFGNVSLYFDNDNSFLDGATFDVKIKNKNDNTDVATITNLAVTQDPTKQSTPYKVDIDLATRAPQIQPGTKIGFEFTLKSVSRDTDLKGRRPEDIVVAVPERQYNLDYAPILESEVIIPTVIESLVVSELKDTSAKLKIRLKGDPANFERVVDNPIVLSIQPDPNQQTANKIPITLITQSQVTRFQDKSRFEIEYDLDNLVPNVEYKILKLQGQDLEIPFGEQNYRLKLEQPGSAQQDASNDAKVFKTPFTELSPERIILTQAPRNYNSPGTTPKPEYAPENLTLNLDPVSMWSLNNKRIKVKFKALDPAGKPLTSGENAAEKEYEFDVRYDDSKKALTASLNNKEVTDANDQNLYPSTTYKISQIKTVDADVSSQITLNLDDAQASAPNTNNLEFTTQLAQPPLVKAGITNFYNHSGKEDTFEQTIYFAFDDPYRAIDEASMKDWKLILEGTEDKNWQNNSSDAINWIQVAKYEPNFTDSFIELYNPRELAGPPTEYEEGPELQRLLIQQAEVDKQIQTIENEIKNFDQQDRIRINLIKELATRGNKRNYEVELERQGAEIKEAITQRLQRLRDHRAQLDRIQVLTKYKSDVFKSSPHLTNPNPHRRYFAFTLKGDASWLIYYKMRVAIQYKYFKDNESREASEFSKLITNINTNQTTNRNRNRPAYVGSGGTFSAQNREVSRIQTIELDDFAKYTNRILLKKSEIKPLNQIGAYIEMEFEDPKQLLEPLKDQFSKAQITGVSDLGNWVDLSSKIFFDLQKTLIRDSTTPTRQQLYKVDGSNDTGISNVAKYNSFRRDSGFIYNLDFDLKGYDYDLSNPFGSLLTNPNKEYIELTQQIPKTLEPRQQPKVNTTHEKFYAIRLAKVDVQGTKTKIGLIITYHWSNPQAFAKKIISIYPKLLNPNERWLSENQHNDYEPLVPVFSPNVNLTFMTSPIIQKEDPYWGNFWANPSGNVWHGSEVRQYDKRTQGGQIVAAFERSLFQKMYRDFHDQAPTQNRVNHDTTFFIGPTGPVKTLIPESQNNPGMADPNIADQIYGTPYANVDMSNWLTDLFKRQTRHPFGIKSATYDPAAKFLKIQFNNPENKIRFGVKLQEILPTVSYAAFVDQAGKIYLFGNKNGVPIKLQDDINVNDQTLYINLAPPNWSEEELPKAGTNLNFMGLLVFPYLPPNFTQNPALRGDVGQNHYVENQQYKNFNPGNGQPVHKYLFPVKGYDGLQVDAENPYFVPWVSHDKAWLRITY
ncbi:zinc ribbon domain-containing protein [Mesomycoplasma ovipneumoniae]